MVSVNALEIERVPSYFLGKIIEERKQGEFKQEKKYIVLKKKVVDSIGTNKEERKEQY